MIVDVLQRARFYEGLEPRIAAALKYLTETDFAGMPDGRHKLDGDRLFAIVQRYRPRPAADARWEAHRQYVDVQYVAAGVERMGWTALHDGLKVAVPYDPAKDVVFFDARGQFFDVPAGHFVVFGPGDVHAPGLAATASPGRQLGDASARVPHSPADAGGSLDEVLKVVVKCRLET